MSRGNRLISCPHCNGRLGIRTSRAVTPTYRELQVACMDVECGATFGVSVTITHAIVASAQPNPAVTLRQAPPRKRPANDTVPAQLAPPCGPEVPLLPANDDDGLTEAIG